MGQILRSKGKGKGKGKGNGNGEKQILRFAKDDN